MDPAAVVELVGVAAAALLARVLDRRGWPLGPRIAVRQLGSTCKLRRCHWQIRRAAGAVTGHFCGSAKDEESKPVGITNDIFGRSGQSAVIKSISPHVFRVHKTV